MQSWPQGQNGGDDDNNSWQQNFNFAPQNGHFNQNQAWSQPVPGQTAYARQLPSDHAANFIHDPQAAMLSGYQAGHGSFDLGHQFSGQDVIDPAFSSIAPDLYAQQNKIDLGGGNMHHMNQVQSQPQDHSQGFSQQNYASFDTQPQNDQQYGSAAPQFSPGQLLPQASSRQQSHTPVQQFSNIQPDFAQAQLRPSQTPPVQHQQPYAQNQNATFAPPQVNDQAAQYQSSPGQHVNYQQSPAAEAYSQPAYTPTKVFDYQQPGQPGSHNPSFRATGHQVDSHLGQPLSGTVPQYDGTPRSQQSVDFEKPAQPSIGEGPARKRQRVAKAATDSPVPEAASVTNSTIDTSSRKVEELDSLVAPTPSPEEAQMLQQFHRRSKAAQAKFPSIKGLPYLAYQNTIKLPAPKSYDKLAPLVAVPPRSKKPIVPELGYDLPCEVQGRFTGRYRPAFDRIGLDERRMESKSLLDEFDNSMKALGKRRPKYTEYPHAFKEQLKSDEAYKNKAEKKAKKELEEEKTKPIRPATRPTDPVEAAAWDAIGIVHIDPSITKTSALVAGRVQQAGDFFIKLRGEMNQAKQELDQATKENKPESELTQLRKAGELRKEVLHRAFDVTIEHADDSVLDNLGGHQKLVLSLVNVLIASIKAGDFSGKLPKIVLELFTHFPMTKKLAETPSFDTVRKRLFDKGDDEVKQFAREISVKVKKTLKLAEGDTSTGYTGTSAAGRAKTAISKAAPSASSTKRNRDDDHATDGRTVKKVAVESGGGSLSKKLAQPKIQLQSASKTTAAKPASSSILGDKNRSTTKPAPKSDSTSGADSSSVSSEDKNRMEAKKAAGKPEAAKIAPSKSETKPPAPKMAGPPSSSALSGIASLLDSINAPQAVTPPSNAKEPKGSDTPETEEERAKRLRKEARRKLRVSWKPEKELVQVKIFEKEDEEDEGREMNMIRDAADDKSEGMVLKQRADVEEDDDDEDVPYQPWEAPTATDFSPLSEDARNKNFTTRGGTVSFKTTEQERIAQREQRELMAIYGDPADIPPSPKSPPPETSTMTVNPKVGQLPQEGAKFEEILTRWRDEQHMGVEGVLYSATQRLNAKSSPSNVLDSILGRLQGGPAQAQTPKQASSSGSTVRGNDTNVPLTMGAAVAEQVLAWLRSDQAKHWHDPNPIQADPTREYHYSDPSVHAAALVLEALSKNLAGRPYPATAPPDWLAHDEERVREWWIGYNKEAALREKRAEEERMRAEAENAQRAAAAAAAAAAGQGQGNAQDWSAYLAQQSQNNPAYAPYLAILQQMNGGQTQGAHSQHTQVPGQPPQIPDNQIQSILAAMGQAQQPGQAPPSNASPYHPNDPSYQQLLMLTQMAQGQQPSVPGGGEHDRGRDRDWDDWDRHDRDRRHDRHDDHGRGESHGRGHRDNKKKKPGPSTIHKPPNAALIGTKPCTFWQQGKCARGDKCTFRHD